MNTKLPKIISDFYTNENQWFSDGWRYDNGFVYSISEDRKDQCTIIGPKYTIEEFLSIPELDITSRNWLTNLLATSSETDTDSKIKNL